MTIAHRFPALYGILLSVLLFITFALTLSMWNTWQSPINPNGWTGIIMHTLIAWICGILSAKKSQSLGWLHGLWCGIGYLIWLIALRGLIDNFDSGIGMFGLMSGIVIVAATIGGIMGRKA